MALSFLIREKELDFDQIIVSYNMVTTETKERNDWIFDSGTNAIFCFGATAHMCHSKEQFLNLVQVNNRPNGQWQYSTMP